MSESRISQNYRSLTPAYGRDYKNRAAVKIDWKAEKDFVLQPDGVLINRQQFAPRTWVSIRYYNLRRVCVVMA